MTFTDHELQACAAREAALRKRVYAKHGKDTDADRREVEMMEAIAAHFKERSENGKPGVAARSS